MFQSSFRAPKHSITRGLVIALTGLATVFWLIASSLSVVVMHDELDQSLDSALQEAAQRLLTLAAAGLGEESTPESARTIEKKVIAPHEEYLTYQLRDADGRVVLSSHEATSTPFPAPLKRGFYDSPEFRIFTEASADGTLYLQLAEAHMHRHEAILEASLALVLPLALLVPLTTVAIIMIVRQYMVPIHRLQQEISQRGEGNLSPLGQFETAAELAPVATAVDHLLTRLRAALDAERAFAANSAHELRTPLASALARLQRLRHTLDEPVANERAALVEADLKRLAHLSEKLLQLSRADGGIGLAEQSSDLGPVLQMVAEDVARSRTDRAEIKISPQPPPALHSRMDVDAFGIVLRNLLENALTHGDPTQPVEVRVGPGGRISIANRGQVVPADQLPELTRRFKRGTTGGSGAGLGLAIADTLLRQSGGELKLVSPAVGQPDGFEAFVELPLEKV